MSYNFDAETWLIIYPHGAGGRFLSMLLSLDPAMAGLDGDHQPPTRYLEYRNTILYGDNAHWLDHELSYTKSYLAGVDLVDTMINRKKYIFSGHMDQVWMDREFYARCKNLKIINISIASEVSRRTLEQRRLAINGGLIDSHELTLSQVTPTLCQALWNVSTIDIDLLDLWSLPVFIPWFKDFIKEHKLNINLENWNNLYLLWHEKLNLTLNPAG